MLRLPFAAILLLIAAAAAILFLLFYPSTTASSSVQKQQKQQQQQAPTVKIAQGVLQGSTTLSRKGLPYSAFLGIPYGSVPRRFDPPSAPQGWEGSKSFTTQPPPCAHYAAFSGTIEGIEDCLFLNVYSPIDPGSASPLLPVLVWFSPGGYQIGGARYFDPTYIMDHSVLFVPINNRLGALGFLNTGSADARGNMGLKDQLAALRWIKDNIRAFGGNPDSVTIMGYSAGSASVEYMMLSPAARGLFHRVIGQSGSALNPWAFQHHPLPLAEEYAGLAGCGKELGGWGPRVECLRRKNLSDIITAQLALMVSCGVSAAKLGAFFKFQKLGADFDFLHMKFVPSVEVDGGGGSSSPFLLNTPYNLMRSGKMAPLPAIFGFNENEGAFYIAHMIRREDLLERLNSEFPSMAPHLFYYDGLTPAEEKEGVGVKIWDFYIGRSRTVGWDNRRNLSNIYSDRFFTNGITRSISLQSRTNPAIYPYIMDYNGGSSLNQIFFGAELPDGVGHGDIMIYMFHKLYGYGPEIRLGTRDGDFSEMILNLFAKFAGGGMKGDEWSGGTWKAQDPTRPVLLYPLNLEGAEMLGDEGVERRRFWDSLPIQEHDKLRGESEEKEEL